MVLSISNRIFQHYLCAPENLVIKGLIKQAWIKVTQALTKEI